MKSDAWLLLLYGLPSQQATERVSLWRKLRKFGALQLKNSAYVLPDTPAHFERFQWLAQQVRDGGGETTLIRVTEIEGLTGAAIAGLFNDARTKDYRELMAGVNTLLRKLNKKRPPAHDEELEKLRARFAELRLIDYFDCPAAHDVEMLLQRAAGASGRKDRPAAPLDPKAFAGKTWLTRLRPEIDRVGSAWLIRTFIDPQAKFVFATKPATHPDAIPYDMADVEFTHHGDDCTFETLLKRFAIQDQAARQIGEMIHDADLEDGKFKRPEATGLDRVFKGWARLGLDDQEILAKGFGCFDALRAELRAR